MGKRTQISLTTIQQLTTMLLNSNFANSIPVRGQPQYDDFYAFMTEFIPIISHEVSQICGGLSFIPYLDTKEWFVSDLYEGRDYISLLYGMRLYLQDFLTEETAITYFGEELEAFDFSTEEGDYILMPRRDFPYTAIDFHKNSTTARGGFGERITVTGLWCYHTDLSQLYQAAPDTSITIDGSSTTLEVVDEAVYEDLQYIRVENEIMHILSRVDVPGGNDQLTVQRGVNGTSAAAHTSKPVRIIKPMRDIQSLAAYLVGYSWNNRNTIADSIQVTDVGVIIPKMPQRYQATVNRYDSLAQMQIAGMV